MADPVFLQTAVTVGLVAASALTLLAGYRTVRAPTTPDRVVALDTIGTNIVAITVLSAIGSGFGPFILVGLVLAIIGFVSTVAVANYLTEGDVIR